ncbi:MAG: type IV pilus assembly protein PilM [Candidatus Portnoybacteria bacterium]|nr:type IV pilus assembly protein PilM [Candidatus Portnoybacteria bacterium]
MLKPQKMFNLPNSSIHGFGIDLSDLSIKIIDLKKKGGNFELASFGRQEIPAGLIENGEIKKEEELIALIKKSVKEVKGRGLKSDYCIVSLPETESFVRLVHLPLMKKEEMAEAIKWEIEANIPLSLPEIYYDWRVIETAAGARQDYLDILIGVLPQRTVDPYLSVLKKAGLKPFVFEIESLAIARALVPGGCCDKPLLIIDVGAKRTSLAIFSGQTVYFTASLPISNSSIVETMSEKLNIDQEKAKQIKIEQGLDYKNPGSLTLRALAPLMDETTKKIKDYIDYYQEHLPAAPNAQSNKISSALLCGGGANFAGLPEFLTEKLGFPVFPGNPWSNVFKGAPKNISGLSSGEALSFATAIGLAIRGLKE